MDKKKPGTQKGVIPATVFRATTKSAKAGRLEIRMVYTKLSSRKLQWFFVEFGFFCQQDRHEQALAIEHFASELERML